MAYFNIAIDGPAGAGKSTLARALARELGFLYVDTGAIYRTVGLYVVRQGRDCSRAEEVIPLLPEIPIRMASEADGMQHMYLDAEDVTEEIRQNHVSAYAAQVSAIPELREFLLQMQRELAETNNVVMDGRDIGTVILPNADVKIFLTASAERRAERRHLELREKGMPVPFEQLLAEIRARDEADCKRPVSPLQRTPDAVLLDTSDLNLDESLCALLKIIKEKLEL